MNVALFASAFYPHLGGVEECCRNLALEYGRRGHRVSVLTSRHPHTLPAHETTQGADVWRFPFELPQGSPAGMARFARQFPRDLAALVRLVRRQKADVIHVQCVGPNGFYALWTARLTGLPLVVTTQGERTMDAGKLYEKSATANWTLRELLKRADYVTACSRQTLDDVTQWSGLPLGHKSRPVYNGIALDEFDSDTPAYPHPRPYILAIGRAVPQKGFDVLLDAYALLARQSDPIPDLLIAGDGPERTNLSKRTQELGLTDRVHFLGFADRPKAVALFRGCQVFVLPSRQEPQGIVNLEAMACAKPVIASRVGGVPEIVEDGKTGLLVPGEDPPALAHALQSLLDCPERAHAMGQAGRARILAEFTWPQITDQYLDIYARLRTHP